MAPEHNLKNEFFNFLSNNSSLLEWLTQESLCGICVLNEESPEELWMNEALKKKLGIVDSDPPQKDKATWFAKEIKSKILDFRLNSTQDGKNEEDDLKFKLSSEEFLGFRGSMKKFNSSENKPLYILRITGGKEKDETKKLLDIELRKNSNLMAIYHETNKIAKVGGWEVDLLREKVVWTKVTKDIHEVPQDYEPNLAEGINFYKPGWSRDKIIKLFGDAVEKGIPFDAEFKLITANNNEIWVRSLGKPEFKDGKCVRVYGAFQNIDAEKRTQLEFEKTREQFEMIYKNSSVGTVLVKRSGKLLQLNPATYRIFGFDLNDKMEVMEMTFKDLIHPDSLEEALVYRWKLLNGEMDNYQLESKYYKKDGSLIWCRTNTSIIRSEGDGEDLVITQVEDITDKKQLEFEASENAKRFKAAFEYSPNGMGVVSIDGEWLMVNQNLASIFGYTKEEFVHKTSRDLTHPDDLYKDSPQLKALLNREIDTYSVEKRLIHRSGKTVFGLLNVSTIVDDSGKPIYLIGQINDITKRIQSERALQKSLNELQSLLDATTQVSIIQTDLKGVVQKFNKGAENLLGYNAQEVKYRFNVKGLHEATEVEERGRVLSEELGKEISGFDVFTFQAKRGHYDSREWTYIRKDGSKFPVQLVVTAIRNHAGRITGYLGVATDISQLKLMEVSLIKARKKAEAANKSKSEFLANMSHEIRTPLNGIIGFTDLLMRTELEDSQQKYMHTIYNSANSLMDIINDVLDFSKIEAGKLELAEERVDLIELCDQTIDIVKHQAHQKGLEVLMNISPSLNRYVYTDPVRLRQILTNLLGNSVKFTNEGEIELSVSSNAIARNENEKIFTFAIRDTGIGIAPENLKKIFHAFDQEDASTTRKYGGSGLGLTISNQLLKLMDSELHVKSELENGSVFSFEVRIRTDTEINYQPSESKSKIIKNVLIVDDNLNNRMILNDMLEANSIDSIACENGIEALSILQEGEEQFDLAIIDYNMPYMNGLSLIEEIRNNLKMSAEELPLILLHSSTEDNEILNGCRVCEVRFNLTKPIQIHTLYRMIEAIENPEYIMNIEKKESTSEVDRSKAYNILIVEDNPVNKFLANTMVKKILPNANLIQAENGEDAIEQFKDNKLDLIFMDLQMPIMGGFEATEEIRKIEEENSYTPIIALTARAVKNEREKCIEAGMDDYLTKPVILEDIKDLIDKYLTDSAE
ncbi:PAS domain S-box protein [Salegentibacter sp. HM20]